VSSVGFGAECDCVDVAHKIGTTILFRHKQSGDIYQSAFEKYWLHKALQLTIFIVRALYSRPRISAHS